MGSKGFYFLLQRDVTNAIIAFSNSDAAYPTYYQVYEIANLLRQRRATLTDNNSSDWQSVYATIVSKMSWQMPIAAKKKILNLLQPSLTNIPKPTASITQPKPITPQLIPSSPSNQLSVYGPVVYDITLGNSQRWGYYDDAKRLVNIALDKINPKDKNVSVRVSTANKKFAINGNEPVYIIRQDEAKPLTLYGFTYKLKLAELSNDSASISLERYDK